MSNTTLTITPTTDAKAGEEISVAVSINTDSPSSIEAFDLSFSFDPEQLEPLSDSDLSEPFSVAASAGSLTASWGTPIVNAGVGSLTTSQASATPLTSGAGEILILKFRIKDNASGPIAVRLIENVSMIMEDLVQFSAIDGTISLTGNTWVFSNDYLEEQTSADLDSNGVIGDGTQGNATAPAGLSSATYAVVMITSRKAPSPARMRLMRLNPSSPPLIHSKASRLMPAVLTNTRMLPAPLPTSKR